MKFLQQHLVIRTNIDQDNHILQTKHNTLNEIFTYFDLSWKILWNAIAEENIKTIPCCKKVIFVIDSDMTLLKTEHQQMIANLIKNHHYLALNTTFFKYIHIQQNQFFKEEKDCFRFTRSSARCKFSCYSSAI